MPDITDGPDWDKQREEIESQIVEMLALRAQALDWYASSGKLSKRGRDGALDVVMGIATGFQIAKHPAASWMANQAWLCAVRGTEERFPFTTQVG